MDDQFDFKLILFGAAIIAIITAGFKLSQESEVDYLNNTDDKFHLEDIKMYCRIIKAVYLIIIATVADKLAGTDN